MKNLISISVALVVLLTLCMASISVPESVNADAHIFEFQPNASVGKDSFIAGFAALQNTNYGGSTYLRVQIDSTANAKYARSLLSFNVSELGNVTVVSALLSLYCYDSDGVGRVFNMYRTSNSSWVAGAGDGDIVAGVTWNEFDGASSWDTPGGDYNATVPAYVSSHTVETDNWQSWDATDLIQDAIDNRSDIVEVFIKANDESYEALATWNFYSSDYGGDATLKPKLTVTTEEVTDIDCDTDTLYEYYTSGDNYSAHNNGTLQHAQTFETGSAHSLTSVSLKLYRINNPETVTVGIQPVDSSGHPTGVDFISASINGATLTAFTVGAWYCFDFTSELYLSDNTTYAIVLSQPGTDPTDCVKWLYNSAGSYSGGNFEESGDSGDTWTATAASDFMFKVYGAGSVGVSDVKIFANVIEAGDMYFAILYKVWQPTEYPLSDPQQYYDVIFSTESGANPVVKRPLPAWGYAPISLYLSPETVTAYGVEWQGEDYIISIEGPANYVWEIEDTDWMDAYQYQLYSDGWVIDTALTLETYYGVDLVLDEWEGNALDVPILNVQGGLMFQTGMADLEEICSEIFLVIEHEFDWSDPEYSDTWAATHNWVTILGTSNTSQIPLAMSTIGSVFNLGGSVIVGLAFFCSVIAMGAMVSGQGIAGTGVFVALAIVMLSIGAWLGIIAYALIAIAAILTMLFFVWIIWWRAT